LLVIDNGNTYFHHTSKPFANWTICTVSKGLIIGCPFPAKIYHSETGQVQFLYGYCTTVLFEQFDMQPFKARYFLADTKKIVHLDHLRPG
jgi:hypothetical protein